VLDPDWHFLFVRALDIEMMFRVLLAFILGGVIGLERELKGKPAGLRTNMFICFGSAMFTILSERLAGDFGGDHTRIAAQIIPGIGFIGAGAIIYGQGSVRGLTTAASLWLTAALGFGAGAGAYVPVAVGLFLGLFGLWPLRTFERRFLHLRREALVITTTGDASTAELRDLLEGWRPTDMTFRVEGDRRIVEVTVRTGRAGYDRLIAELSRRPEVLAVTRQQEEEG
jgi:putative Mg2+ transporter-C (MgtC) family protein